MTAHLSFDTLAFAKRLAAAGMASRQAQALAEALNDIVFDTLATKNDLRELEVATKASLKELELATKASLKELEAGLKELEHRLTHSLTARMGAMSAAIIAILSALKVFS
ncbi:MAG TPA: hypothetical protein VGB04_08035 [Allosphingosinicella sp.]|jgi:hypothetical protein